jgi:hypothetical protein
MKNCLQHVIDSVLDEFNEYIETKQIIEENIGEELEKFINDKILKVNGKQDSEQ